MFLTGDPATVHEIGRKYGIIAMAKEDSERRRRPCSADVSVDRNGSLRVQYMGASFDPEEFEVIFSASWMNPVTSRVGSSAAWRSCRRVQAKLLVAFLSIVGMLIVLGVNCAC